MKSSLTAEDDPLSKLIAPPHDETPVEREERLALERLAKKHSDSIDEELARERSAAKKTNAIKVLLLGQSEGGKSTVLKNFQLINSPKAFRAERASWRAVVQLNVARSIRLILEAMTEAQTQLLNPPDDSSPIYPALTPEHLKLKMRLSPLVHVEEALWRKLSPERTLDYEATHLSSITNIPHYSEQKEWSVNSSTPWKTAFTRFLSNGRDSVDSGTDVDLNDPSDPAVILHNCAEDMIRLWNDPTIKDLLRAHRLRLEDMPGFFLDSLERVTARDYVPSDDDVLRARIKTLGVSEHRFSLKAGNMVSHDWRVFDVGGARTLRSAWAPYFDDMNAIIFLAPLSCFDQVLSEDPTVNRLEDSINLWKSVASNLLLKDTDLILFLNKCDILQSKLKSGIMFNKWVLSYGDRPNTFEGTSNYMRKKFGTILKQLSPKPRTFYVHCTSLTDFKATTHILGNVKDILVRQNLQDSQMV